VAVTLNKQHVLWLFPQFEPHVTLLSNLPNDSDKITPIVSRLAEHIRPFEIHFPILAAGSTYFQCVFAKAQPTGSISTLYDETCRLFEVEPNAFMPHLSLVYGDFTAKQREQIIQQLADAYPKSFQVTGIRWYLVDGTPEQWRLVKEFRFSSI
jgi:2'-5' RNA ligase